MSEFLIKKEGKFFKIYDYSDNSLLFTFLVKGFFRNKIWSETSDFYLQSGLLKSNWKILGVNEIITIKIKETIKMKINDVLFLSKRYKERKITLIIEDSSKQVFSINKTLIKTKKSILLEDSGYLKTDISLLMAVLILYKWNKEFI